MGDALGAELVRPALTLNFLPYHHKPPMLFWLINTAWSVFGVSRWAALVPIGLASFACVYLTQTLAKKIFKTDAFDFENLPIIMMGSLPFLFYNTLIMFDLTLTVFFLCALLALHAYAEDKQPIYILALALALGLGVLAKGPVAWLYAIFPILLAPWWVRKKQDWFSWYRGYGLAIILSTIPVGLWIIPVIRASTSDFATALIWDQTVGRITGSMGSAHNRSIYFYLPLLPILFIPWALLPSFWAGIRQIQAHLKTDSGLRFLACSTLPAIIAFSFIGGKQPHYLLPLLPGFLILIAYCVKIPLSNLVKISAGMVLFFIIVQGIISQTEFIKKYDLKTIATYVHQHEDKDWAFVPKYQDELTFLGRLQKPIDNQALHTVETWLNTHPGGMAIIRFDQPKQVANFQKVMTVPYRGKNMGIFTGNPNSPAPEPAG
jgi:4-amino-4-deoxy-L-arabinose transferase-like glycosyltransferase